MPRRRRKEVSIKQCRYHLLGYYFDKDVNIRLFTTQKDLKERVKKFQLFYWSYCPICGKFLTNIIKENQLGEDYYG